MKHLVIRNLGPLKESDIELKRINVIIGSQSSGKSCVLKTACYCTWVEKRIELTQTSDFFAKDNNFLNELERFHKLKGYIKDDTFIQYESDYMMFSYNNATKIFSFDWKKNRWKYRRSKVTYIPAERNIVAVIPNLFEVKFADDNILNFIVDWNTARRSTNNLSILNLGVSYHYDADTGSDKVQVDDDVYLDLTNTSSGLQSLIPMFVHLNHLITVQVGKNAELSVKGHNEITNLIKKVFDNVVRSSRGKVSEDIGKKRSQFVLEANGEANILQKSDIQKIEDVISQYIVTDHCDIFLEEPEANLFPPTQSNVVEWLLAMTTGKQSNNLFVATHSPYILTSFLEKKNIDMTLLYTRMSEGKMIIRSATEQDIQGIYDYGVDAFFNIESLG
ncbi:MAG: ATP-binding protein [Paludibacteraceae bacterium]|nr:ATP-binding protein [Paludibacteraceae bacterium]MBP5481376.1 ATP-binding protein [Paludibacteraceae bacterium]